MIHFPCRHCGAKLRMPDAHAGKEGRCPRCKEKLTVPALPEAELKLVWDESTAPSCERPSFPARPRRVSEEETARARRQAQELLASLAPPPAPEHSGVRRLPWLIDVLLYPASVSGALSLLGMVITPFLFGLAPLFVRTAGWLFFSPDVVLGLYGVWYLAECVYDSAKGGTRAPELMDVNLHLDELWSRGAYLVAVYILFLAPAPLYWLLTRHTDVIFVGLVAWAVVLFPIGLLAMVIHDSSSALNPLFLLGAVWHVFLPYVGLLLLLAAGAGVFGLVTWILAYGLPPLALGFIGLLATVYALFLAAHLLGRFYWRCRDRLDWGI